MKNLQKGFGKIAIFIMILILMIVGYLLFTFILPTWNESNVNKSRRESFEKYMADTTSYRNDERFYEFRYPKYATINTAGSMISETAVKLTDNYNVSFAVTTSPNDTSLCKSNPYSYSQKSDNKTIVEDKIKEFQNGNEYEYRHISMTDTTKNSEMTEERYYLVKNNICYMIVEKILYPDKVDVEVKTDLKRIFSTFKFTN